MAAKRHHSKHHGNMTMGEEMGMRKEIHNGHDTKGFQWAEYYAGVDPRRRMEMMDSGMINEAWDRQFLERWAGQDKQGLLSYSDTETYRDAGQGGFEIRTFISIAAATKGGKGSVIFYAPIPIFAEKKISPS